MLKYGAEAATSPSLEPFAPSAPLTLLLASSLAALGIFANESLYRKSLISGRSALSSAATQLWCAASGCLFASSVPWLLGLMENWSATVAISSESAWFGPSVWQPLWFAACSGIAAAFYLQALNPQLDGGVSHSSRAWLLAIARDSRIMLAVVLLATIATAAWWFAQSQAAFAEFRLGFNDCGHFAQRVANTAAGRGWLLETPVLPSYWDHFNPGLALLVPLWWLWPQLSLFFLIQAFALSACAPLIYRYARALHASPVTATGWALAWLCHPLLGQMNLAYSYGWHPISLSIPALWLSLLGVVTQRWWLASFSAIVACSFEEGAIVIIATTAAVMWLVRWSDAWLNAHQSVHALTPRETSRWASRVKGNLLPASTIAINLSSRYWFAIATVAVLVFCCVFQFSGLARFQTGRFNALGNSPWEIIASPLLRPDAFWGLLFRGRNAIFLLGLLVPCFIPSLLRGWVCLLPAALPLVVLLMWNHLPAQSLAFHYASVLLPVVWLSSITGSQATAGAALRRDSFTRGKSDDGKPRLGNPDEHTHHGSSAAWAALLSGVIASFSLGQLPWSQSNLVDVEAATFGPDVIERRLRGTADNRFAHQQIAAIRAQATSVLATGRLAAHLVGAPDLETVGQFTERRQALAELTPNQPPLLRYRTIILDRLESFQQSLEQTAAIEAEARAAGFQTVVDQYDIVVLTQPR